MSLREKIIKEKITCFKCYTYLNSSVHRNGQCKFGIISDSVTKDEGAFANITVTRIASPLASVGSIHNTRKKAWLKLFGGKIG